MNKGSIQPEKTDFGPGRTTLYYFNKGLFSDPFLEDRLPNLQKYYTGGVAKFLNQYWNVDDFETDRFNKSFQRLLDKWHELDEEPQKYCKNEAQLEEHWIRPIFELLGWTYEVQDKIERRGKKQWPDYTLYDSKESWKKSRNSSQSEKFFHAQTVADAKAWDISLDGKGYTNANPSFQIVTYMELTKKEWGILTNGQYWRIYSLRSDSKHETYYEIDLVKIICTKDYERFKHFFNFFRVEAFQPNSSLSNRTFLDFVFEDGRFYSQRVEENLKARAFSVVEKIAQGFIGGTKDVSEDELKIIYDHSLYYLFRLMFVLNCESKGLLEVGMQDDYYEYSLRKKCLEIKEQYERNKNWSEHASTYHYINDLFEVLKTGSEKIGVHGFGEEPFENGVPGFYKKNKISDYILNLALIELAFDEDKDKNLSFIDYKILSPDHIGSLFEGLLEYKLTYSNRNYVLVNEKGERKQTGSYYTPDSVVDYIVSNTLKSMESVDSLDDLLTHKVCDPTMGSGHFLLGVVKYIDRLAQALIDNGKGSSKITVDGIKKSILHNCVYGIDVNPLATELSKYSLWILTAKKGDKLEPLNDQIVHSDALVPMKVLKKKFSGHKLEKGFDYIVGNPPYVGEKGNKELFQNALDGNPDLKVVSKGKMDYFYFFIYQGMELLKENGKLCFITTAYWPTADGALNLRNYLAKNAHVDQVIEFGNVKIFKDAPGQHSMIETFTKKKTKAHKVKFLKYVGRENSISTDVLNTNSKSWVSQNVAISSTELENNVWIFEKSQANKQISQSVKLGDVFHVGCGVRTTADALSGEKIKLIPKSKAEKYGLAKDDGIFVLSKEEKDALWQNLNAKEKKIIKQWYKNSEIEAFKLERTHDLFHIYMTNKLDPKDYPNIISHLEKFKEVLTSKKDDYGEENVWYAVNRASADSVTKSEKVLTPYRSKSNRFAYTEDEVYASMDVYFITANKEGSDYPLSLKSLAAVLNSDMLSIWCKTNMKRKGEIIEFYATPLNNIPLPVASAISSEVNEELSDLYDKLAVRATNGLDIKMSAEFLRLNEIVEALYSAENQKAVA